MGYAAALALDRTAIRFLFANSQLRGATRTGWATHLALDERFAHQLGNSLPGVFPVARPAACAVSVDHEITIEGEPHPQPLEQQAALTAVQSLALSDVPAQGNSGIGLVDVLAPRPARTARSFANFRLGERQIWSNLEIGVGRFSHAATLSNQLAPLHLIASPPATRRGFPPRFSKFLPSVISGSEAMYRINLRRKQIHEANPRERVWWGWKIQLPRFCCFTKVLSQSCGLHQSHAHDGDTQRTDHERKRVGGVVELFRRAALDRPKQLILRLVGLLQFHRLDDLGGQLRGDFGVVGVLEMKLSLAARHAGQGGGVVEHFGHRNLCDHHTVVPL